jgi:two-component system phosphate regulon sensor histidine kinase PhoR
MDKGLWKITEDIEEAVVVYTADFLVLMMNRRAEEMFGIAASSIVGRPFSFEDAKTPQMMIFGGVMYPSLAPSLARLSDPGAEPQRAKVVFEDPHREFMVSTRRSGDGFLKVVRETTREGSLLQSKSDFITVAAHQLRTPATAVHWALESIEREEGLSDSVREIVVTGRAAARNLLDVIMHLLDAAQIEDGRFGYSFKSLDLGVFLDVLLGRMLPIGKQRGVAVYLDRPPEPLFASIDSAKLGMAIGNIVDNGIKYNSSGGNVTVVLSRSGDNAEIRITDTGVGIPESDIPRLFQKFYRGEGTMKKVTEGTGLGLYLAKNIIEAHKGSVRVESAEGRGSVFYIIIPLSS